MRKVLNEEIRRIHELMNLNEDEEPKLNYLKRRLSGLETSYSFNNALSTATSELINNKFRSKPVSVEEFEHGVIDFMVNSFFNDFMVTGIEIPEDLSVDNVWYYLLRVYRDEIDKRYYEIMNEPED